MKVDRMAGRKQAGRKQARAVEAEQLVLFRV
jgi:hypothetical protein